LSPPWLNNLVPLFAEFVQSVAVFGFVFLVCHHRAPTAVGDKVQTLRTQEQGPRGDSWILRRAAQRVAWLSLSVSVGDYHSAIRGASKIDLFAPSPRYAPLPMESG
jgi:hypothetical protein